MTTQDMLERLVARMDDPRLSDAGRAEIEKRLAWLDGLVDTLRDAHYMHKLVGVIKDRTLLLRAVDGRYLVNQDGEEQISIEDSVRWNITNSLVTVLEILAGSAPCDEPIDWFGHGEGM